MRSACLYLFIGELKLFTFKVISQRCLLILLLLIIVFVVLLFVLYCLSYYYWGFVDLLCGRLSFSSCLYKIFLQVSSLIVLAWWSWAASVHDYCEIVLISPSNLNDNFIGCSTIGRQSFTFRAWNTSFHSFLDLRDANEKLSSLMLLYLWVSWCFYLVDLNVMSLLCIFDILSII